MSTTRPAQPRQLKLDFDADPAADFAEDERYILEAARALEARHPRASRWPAGVRA